jgi:zinc-finger of a C2HC-type
MHQRDFFVEISAFLPTLRKARHRNMKIAVEAKKPGRNPLSIICHICGRDYGTKSIQIHEPKCMQEWERTQASLPRSLRKPLPVRDKELPSEPSAIASYNDSAFQDYKQNTLVACKVCNRRFLPSSLERHAKVCEPGGYFERHSPVVKK